MFTQSFDAMETPSEVPRWSTVIVLVVLALTWAITTYCIDAYDTAASTDTTKVTPYRAVSI